jgi:hypothetical protein
MSCPFCDVFACYQRQIGRRLKTDTFAMSDDNAHLLVHMALQIRNVTQTTLRLVDNESVPTMLCDLLDGLAEGLMEGLSCKLARAAQGNCQAASSSADQLIPASTRDPC